MSENIGKPDTRPPPPEAERSGEGSESKPDQVGRGRSQRASRVKAVRGGGRGERQEEKGRRRADAVEVANESRGGGRGKGEKLGNEDW